MLVPDLGPDDVRACVEAIFGRDFAGADGFAYRVVPSTAPGSPGFHARSYWRGPTWPVMNWLLWWALREHGEHARAAALRDANLDLLSAPSAHFAEYFEPYTGEPLGSLEQSWTAAVTLDWLAHR
jgi:glycogen debranching enzyme